MYKPGGPGAEARAGAGVGVKALEAAGVGVGVSLPLVGTSGAPLASSSLPVGGGLLQGLQRVRGLAIFPAGLVSKVSVTFVSSEQTG